MTDVETDGAAENPRPEHSGGMRVPRSRGVVSGVLLVLAGGWAAFAPFVGPAFDFAYTPRPNDTWHWTAARGWYEVLPGGLAVFGGLLLILSANRILTSLGAWLAAVAGGWLVVDQQVSYLLTLGTPGTPAAPGDRRYVAEYLAFFTGVGALIIFLAAVALGRLSVRSMRDVRAAARREEQAALAEQQAAEREARERDEFEQVGADRDVTERNAETWAAGASPSSAVTTELPAAGYGAEHAPAPEHTAGPDDDTAAMPVVAAETDHAPEVHEPAAQEPAPSADDDRPSDTATAWNPEAQSPTTTGELPALSEATPPPTAPEPRRDVHAPRRYFGPGNPAPQDETPEQAETPTRETPTRDTPTRDVVRTDESEDLDDLELDERTR